MKTFSLLAGLAFLLSGCVSTKLEVKPEEQIVGVWHLKDYGIGNYEYSQLGFTSNGRKCVVSISMNGDGIPEVDYYDNTWKINNGVLETTVGDSPSSSLPKGYLIKDHIKVLNDNELVLKMESDYGFDSPLEKHQKLHGVKPERICQLVENYARSLGRNNA
ncbi:lipocalin family protein [Gallaecimonas sp. GXIMD4217]|uniref:lipocalin family protein n=1 Tax=Gallaecimonas sp. GXIMD4217 TaxID=3131927 RepID=UPI00311ADA47